MCASIGTFFFLSPGALFAVVSLINLIAVITGNIAFNTIYATTVGGKHGAVYFIGACTFGLPIIFTM